MKEDETPIFVSVNPHVINKNDSKADLSKDWTNCEISLTKLTDVIRQGWAYSAWYKQQRRSNDQFVAINIASIDIDGTRTIDEVVEDPFCQKHLSCLYTTSSHTDQEHRFRLIFILPRVIECQKEYRHVLQALATMLSGDLAATDPARIFFGNTRSAIQTWERSIDDLTLEDLLKTYPRIDQNATPQGAWVSSFRSQKTLDGDFLVTTRDRIRSTINGITKRTSIYCPFHNDQNPSAFVGIKDSGLKFIHCATCRSTWHQTFLRPHHEHDLFDFVRVLRHVSELTEEERLQVLNRLPDAYFDNNLIQQTAAANIHFLSDQYLKLSSIDDGLTLIRSPKGSGKTEAVASIINGMLFRRRTVTLEDFEENEPDDDSPPQIFNERSDFRVLLIGHRQALIRSLCERLKLHCYLDEVMGMALSKSSRNQFGVCIDSISKVSSSDKPYDLVIIDESEQVLAHFLAQTVRDPRGFFVLFKNLVKTARSVVAMDADLGWRTYLVLTDIRQSSHMKMGTNQLKIYVNDYRAANQSLKLYENRNQLISEIWDDLAARRKVFITSNSKNRIEQLNQTIQADFPSLKSLAITSENSNSEDVQQFIGNIRQEAKRFDVILSSPSLGTGVDITFENNQLLFDCVYGIYETLINTHSEIDQQLSRVRHPKEIKVWISPRRFNFESDFQVIKADLLTKNVVANTALSLSNPIANKLFSDDSGDFLRLAALVVSDRMKSINDLRSNFVQYKIKNGWSIDQVSAKDQALVGRQIDALGKQLHEDSYAEQLLNATPINRETFDVIQDRLDDHNAERILDTEWWSYYRMRIELFYQQPLSGDLIKLDDRGQLRRNYYRFARTMNREDHRNIRKYVSHINKKIVRRTAELTYERGYDGMLIHEILRSTGIFDGVSFDCKRELTSSDLCRFVETTRKLKTFLERQVEHFAVRIDINEKPVQQLGALLKLIGIKLKRSRTTKTSNGGKLYHYVVDQDTVKTMMDLHKLQTETTDRWAQIDHRYGFTKRVDSLAANQAEMDALLDQFFSMANQGTSRTPENGS